MHTPVARVARRCGLTLPRRSPHGERASADGPSDTARVAGGRRTGCANGSKTSPGVREARARSLVEHDEPTT